MRVTLLGFTVPQVVMDRILANDSHMPTQTHTFAWSVVKSLRDADVEVTLLSAEPLTSFPGNRRILVRGGWFSESGIEGCLLPFVNLTVLKHLTRFAAGATLGSWALRRQSPDAVLVHGVHSPFLLVARLYRKLLGVLVVTILTDPPGVILATDGVIVAALKRLDRAVVRWLLRGHDGVIVLTAPLAEHYAPAAPSLVMEGIVATGKDLRQAGCHVAPGPITLVYAGGLSRSYGVDRLLEAVRCLPDADIRLRLFGRGELEDEIVRASAQDPRIDPPRFADRSEILAAYAAADVLVQPRPIEQGFVRYSFPSKLMEYLASGTPVVTTRLPGIPTEYGDHVEWADPDSVDGLCAAIFRVIALGPTGRAQRGADAREFIVRTRGSGAQGLRMKQFLENLAAQSDIRSEPGD